MVIINIKDFETAGRRKGIDLGKKLKVIHEPH